MTNLIFETPGLVEIWRATTIRRASQRQLNDNLTSMYTFALEAGRKNVKTGSAKVEFLWAAQWCSGNGSASSICKHKNRFVELGNLELPVQAAS